MKDDGYSSIWTMAYHVSAMDDWVKYMNNHSNVGICLLQITVFY